MQKTDPILSYKFARENGIILLDEGDTATIGYLSRTSADAILETRRAMMRPLALVPLEPSEFDKHLSETYALTAMSSREITDDLIENESLDSLVEDIPQTADLLAGDDDAPVIRFINGLIAEAVKLRGSDIHIEPQENSLLVRLRVDGVLNEIHSLPSKIAPMLVSRIKVMARLDIAEKRLPQDGRISLSMGGRYIDVRVSTLPAQHGERVVLRLLDRDQTRHDIADLGMSAENLAKLNTALQQPNGILLVTGPTGSGKTTTMYAALSILNDRRRNILTVEDPVEYSLEGVGQTQVNSKVGMSFAAGLRAILRQDPDVVMVGEVRDVETAEIAVQASLTGHLVLTTVHTNSAVGAITRLRDMGVQSFLLASSIKLIAAQRLVRKLCDNCKQEFSPDTATKKQVGIPDRDKRTLYDAVGCAACQHSGYVDRIGLYELVNVDKKLRQLIHDDASEQEIAAYALTQSKTLAQSGFEQVLEGNTSLEEVLRVCNLDERSADADL